MVPVNIGMKGQDIFFKNILITGTQSLLDLACMTGMHAI